MEDLTLYIEALIFSSEQSISIEEIKLCISQVFEETYSDEKILVAIESIQKKYHSDEFAIMLYAIAEGYQFLTKQKYHSLIQQLQINRNRKKLSQASLETLAIIAAKQKVTKVEIEHIRGVSSDYTIQKLLEKSLIEIAGKANTVGKPVLYSVSKVFLAHFGLNSLADIPQLKELESVENETLGTPNF